MILAPLLAMSIAADSVLRPDQAKIARILFTCEQPALREGSFRMVLLENTSAKSFINVSEQEAKSSISEEIVLDHPFTRFVIHGAGAFDAEISGTQNGSKYEMVMRLKKPSDVLEGTLQIKKATSVVTLKCEQIIPPSGLAK